MKLRSKRFTLPAWQADACNPFAVVPLVIDAPDRDALDSIREELAALWMPHLALGDSAFHHVRHVVHYNANNILDVTVVYSGAVFYTTTGFTHITLDLVEGKRLKVVDLLRVDRLDALAKRVNGLMQVAMAAAIAYSEPGRPVRFTKKVTFTTSDLERFAVTEKGILFYYDFGLPKVDHALTPHSEYLVPWSRLGPFLRPDGKLGHYADRPR